MADVESEIAGGRSAATLLLEEIGYGIVGGVVGGLLVAAIVVHAGRRGLVAAAWRPVIPAAGTAFAYGTASALGGSGFIAAFVRASRSGWRWAAIRGTSTRSASSSATCSTGSRSCSSARSSSVPRSAS